MVIHCEALKLVPAQIGLEIVVENVVLIRGWQRVLEGNKVDLRELRRVVPINEDDSAEVDYADLGGSGLCRNNLELHVCDLQMFINCHDARSLLSVSLLEVWVNVIPEESRCILLCARPLKVPETNKLNLLEALQRLAFDKEVCARGQNSFSWLRFHNDEFQARGSKKKSSSDRHLICTKLSQDRGQNLQALVLLARTGINRQDVDPAGVRELQSRVRAFTWST
mmetsp:Transcript_658/g.1424  ORF Transcript_658/g.1424 Transcript_658/m.1424 type:complete len:224 (-) Transcript_658:24-695(-)